MSERVERAVESFTGGYNCCQSLLLAHAAEHGLSEAEAKRLGTPFVAGLGYAGQTCGAVVGALLVLGLALGRTEADDRATEKHVAALARELQARFQQRHGATDCKTLRKGHRTAWLRGEHGPFSSFHCTQCVRTAAELVEELLAEGQT